MELYSTRGEIRKSRLATRLGLSGCLEGIGEGQGLAVLSLNHLKNGQIYRILQRLALPILSIRLLNQPGLFENRLEWLPECRERAAIRLLSGGFPPKVDSVRQFYDNLLCHFERKRL
jgi:hypothetical protein